PSERRILGWIEDVFRQGIRRPGYPAERWAESWIERTLRELGLEHVRREPVTLPYWEPKRSALALTITGASEIDCFALPHSTATRGTEAALVGFDPAAPERVRGGIALHDVSLMRMPHAALARRATWSYDPAESFAGAAQVLPFGHEFMAVMEPAIAAGAVGFVGVLRDYPGDSKDYYVPYDAVARPIPGVWIRGSDGARLRALADRGPVRARLEIDATRETITSDNVIGELLGAD